MNKSKVFIYILASFLILTACEKIDLGTEIEVKPGETYKINRNLSFEVDSINDYRCPIGAYCLWSGDVDLYFDFGFDKEVLNLNNEDTNPFYTKGYSIEIINVEPYPIIYPNPGYIPEVIIYLKVEKE